MRIQPCRPLCVASNILRVLAAVDLDRQLMRFGEKIEHIWPERVLATELDAGEAAVAQCRPQFAFGVGHVAS